MATPLLKAFGALELTPDTICAELEEVEATGGPYAAHNAAEQLFRAAVAYWISRGGDKARIAAATAVLACRWEEEP